jgi:hypothetical protein
MAKKTAAKAVETTAGAVCVAGLVRAGRGRR